jgi:hypothetical protein
LPPSLHSNSAATSIIIAMNTFHTKSQRFNVLIGTSKCNTVRAAIH